MKIFGATGITSMLEDNTETEEYVEGYLNALMVDDNSLEAGDMCFVRSIFFNDIIPVVIEDENYETNPILITCYILMSSGIPQLMDDFIKPLYSTVDVPYDGDLRWHKTIWNNMNFPPE